MTVKQSVENFIETMSGKKDFIGIFTVTGANDNGDPNNGNRPRTTPEGYGEMSAECFKRKIRNRLQDMGANIFVVSDDRCTDGCDSLQMRENSNEELKKISAGKETDRAEYARVACKEWLDVRAFGQVFTAKGLSIGVRGPVTVMPIRTVSPVNVVSMPIVKSVNGMTGYKGKSPDTMGTRHFIDFGLFVVKGSISCQLAEKTGFTDADAEMIKQAILTLFENDASAARPEGSMEVRQLYWWDHDCKTPAVSSAKIHRSLKITEKDPSKEPTCFEDYIIELEDIPGIVKPEIYTL